MMAHSRAASKEEVLRILRESLPDLSRRYGVARCTLYGSFSRGEPGPESDVDVLVELTRPLGLEFVDLVYDLEQRLGRRVEVITFDTLQSRLKHRRYREVAEDIERTLIDVKATAG